MFKSEFEFFESVKYITKLSKENIYKIYYLKFKEGRSLRSIAKEIGVNKNRVIRLFNLDSAEKLRQKKRLLYQLNKKPLTIEQKLKNSLRRRERYLQILETPSLKSKEEKRKSKRRAKWRAKTALINEVFKQPDKYQKHIWNGIGNWSRKYEACVECHMTLYRHNAFGLCYVCYLQLQAPNNVSYNTSKIKTKEYLRLRHERRKTKFQKALELIENNEIKVDTKIHNILDNLGF